MNSIVFRVPTCTTLSDASEHGVGGYELTNGESKGWKYEFTKEEREVFTLNTKEYIGDVINAKVFLPKDNSTHPCLLSIGDSTCAAGWLQKSNFDPDTKPIHMSIAR